MNQHSSIFRETARLEPTAPPAAAAATATATTTAAVPVTPAAATAAPYGTVTPAAARARQLAERMRASLAAAGFEVERDFPSLRGDITVSNEPFLTLGRLTPAVTEHLVAALTNSREEAVAAA